MYTAFNKAVNEFIHDFELLKDDVLLHFQAKILYIFKGVPFLYNCEVAIVPIKPKKLDAIYFLSSEILDDGFEDMLIIKNDCIKCNRKESLFINKDSQLKVYIFPTNSNLNIPKLIESTTFVESVELH